MAENKNPLKLRFLKGTEISYDALTEKDPNTFYFTGDDLYLGEIKLSSENDLKDALLKIEKNKTDIGNLTELKTKNKENLVSAINEATEIPEGLVFINENGDNLLEEPQIDADTLNGHDSSYFTPDENFQEIKTKLEYFLYNPVIDAKINPDNLATGIYQYWGTYYDTSPFTTPHIIVDFNAQSLRFQIGTNHTGSVVFRSRGATEVEWTQWKNIDEIENRLTHIGLLSEGIHSCAISTSYPFEEFIKRITVSFFTNWVDDTNFPFKYGSGILIPGADARYKYMLYANMGTVAAVGTKNLKFYLARVYIPNDPPADSNDTFPLEVVWENILNSNNVSNPNLLINPDFKICQRNMIEYNTNKTENGGRYYPDRWICRRDYNDSGLKYTIQEDGLHAKFMNTTGSWGSILYRFDTELSKSLSNKIITMSGKIKINGSNIKGFNLYQGSNYIINSTPQRKVGDDLYITTVKMPEITEKLVLEIRFDGSQDSEIIFEYIKMELGNEATLFSPPDKATELLKCQRYYQRIGVPNGSFHAIILNMDSYTTSIQYLTFYYNLSIPMRTVPTVKLYGTANTNAGYSMAYMDGNSVDTSFQWSYEANTTVSDKFRIIVHNTSTNKFDTNVFTTKHLVFYTNSGVELDAEIY